MGKQPATMQLISTLALASALVAPAAPKASTTLKGATLDDQLKKIPGVSPLKNAPADYGFDPLGFAKVSYPRFGLPESELLRTNNLRDAELRHGRLAMVAVVAYVVQEAMTGEPVTSVSEQFFTPIIYYPWVQHLLTTRSASRRSAPRKPPSLARVVNVHCQK